MSEKVYLDEAGLGRVLGKIDTEHVEKNVASQNGIHGFRYYNGNLQYYDTSESSWSDIDVQAVTPVGDVSNVATSTDGQTYIDISWQDPEDVIVEGVTLAKWAGTILVRKVGSAPVNESDGTLLVNSTTRDAYASTAYSDTGVQEGVVYYYRLFPYTETGRATDGTFREMGLIPDGATVTPVDDIQTWLQCGGVYDKNYTVLSQVLSDTSTLSALISDSNAVDYMVRSTTWASDICSDQNAMTYIGLNNYCSDSVLSDTTWLDAICNSIYFESVLNVKVPTMTSNTTPSGECSAQQRSLLGQAPLIPYNAFDGVTTGTNGRDILYFEGYKDGWFQYKFPNAKKNIILYIIAGLKNLNIREQHMRQKLLRCKDRMMV